jgi:CBS domain containing-hemolysin-like protein
MNIFFLAGAAETVGAAATSWDAPGIIIVKLLAVVFLVLLNGFFVASEFAIVKVRSTQLDALAARGNEQARLARHVTSHLDAYLSATQLGITLASLGLGWLGAPFLANMIEPFFGLANITSPVRLILDESAKAARICPVSQEIVANAFEIRRRVVREVMTPRGEVVYLDTGLSFRDNLQRAKAARHTRFPLCAEHFDRTIGLVHIKDMLVQLDEPEPSLLAIKKELVVVPEMLPLEKLLTHFRDRQAHLALVIDEFGSNVGIVTLQHIIIEVIGQLPDEFGLERREFQRLDEDEFRVDGGLGIREMRDLAGLEWKDEDVITVGGYVVHRLGYLPSVGEQVHIDEYIVTVEQADGRRVKQLRFQRVPKKNGVSDDVASHK